MLNDRIRDFYDASTGIWLDTWGEHMHHGHYGEDGTTDKANEAAQIDLIEELLAFGEVDHASRILDSGCGVGGSSRYLAQKFDAEALGFTLSPVQAAAAAAYNATAGLADRVTIRAQDVYTLDPSTPPFDLVWSLESAEHMADKQALFDLFYRHLAPGGRLLMITWCIRETPPALMGQDHRLLQQIYDYYHLPPMVPISALQRMATNAGFEGVRTADWSDAVAPFWGKVIQSAMSWKSIRGLLKAGPGTLRGAWAMRYMQSGYRRSLIRFGVLAATKPA